MNLEWKEIDDGARDGEDVLAWGPRLGYLVVAYDDEAKPDFPWLTLDGPSYHRDGFELYARLPFGSPVNAS